MPGPTFHRKIAINRSIFYRFSKIKCHYSCYSMLHEMKLNKIHKNQNKIFIGSPYYQCESQCAVPSGLLYSTVCCQMRSNTIRDVPLVRVHGASSAEQKQSIEEPGPDKDNVHHPLENSVAEALIRVYKRMSDPSLLKQEERPRRAMKVFTP